MTDPRIAAALKAIEQGTIYDFILVSDVLPAALRLLEAVEDFMHDTHECGDCGYERSEAVNAAAAEFLALLPAVKGKE